MNNGIDETIPRDEVRDRYKLGTFDGVFTPAILTILGVIMFLRFGWVVGHAGLIGTLVIVTICTSITFLTALSISIIATDQTVRTGGAYYMISRSLGVEIGGVIGIPLYFALALSVPLYIIGFAESVTATFPALNQRIVGVIAVLMVALLAVKSARLAIRAQYIIMAAIAFALLSFFLGSAVEPTEIEMFGESPAISPGFWTVLAVFFPAVTGIMAGVNMSGDLKNPGRALPLGTLAAVLTGYVVYMALPLVLAMRADASTLIEDPMIMRRIARWGNAILLGVWGATLSSAIGSVLGAPRVLQALSRDGVLPRQLRWLGKGSGPADQPRWGTLLTVGVALILVATVELNTIAPVLTMFFLTTYMVLNLVAGIEQLLRNPSFRPAFRVHWGVSFLGSCGCLVVMFLIQPVAAAVSITLVLSIYLWLQRREMLSAWGDVRRGIWMMLLRTGLLQLDSSPDPRNWRPNILVLSGAPTSRWHLIRFADLITYKRGLVTVATILPEKQTNAARQEEMESTTREYLNKRGIPALVRIVQAPDPFTGARSLISAYGFGPLTPNIVLLGDSENTKPEHRHDYCEMISSFHQAGRNVVIFREDPGAPIERPPDRPPARIDVWWGGLQGNGGLMLIMADLLRMSPMWRSAELRINLVVSESDAVASARSNLERILDQMRIDAESVVIDAAGRSFNDLFRTTSQDADIIFRGLAEPGEDFTGYYENTREIISGMPTTVLALAGAGVGFSEVLQKKGR